MIMQKYSPLDPEKGRKFLAAVRSAMASPQDANPELLDLSQILSNGLLLCSDIPYFSGIDWNPENVLLDGTTPKFIDGFNVSGSSIVELLNQGMSVELVHSPVDLD